MPRVGVRCPHAVGGEGFMAPVGGLVRKHAVAVVTCVAFAGTLLCDAALAQESAPPVQPTAPAAQSPVTSTTPVASPPNAAAATATSAPHDWATWRPNAPGT